MKLVEYEQPTSVPVPKVAAAGVAGVVVTAVVTVLALTGVIVPDSVSQGAVNAVGGVIATIAAMQTVITFVAAYLKKDKKPAAAVEAIKREG